MDNTPQCIGIILDGNRRYAKKNNLPSLEGHRLGFEKLVDCAKWVRDRGIPHLVVYAFSTENWNRSEEEVSYLMQLIKEGAERWSKELSKEGIRLRFIGKLEMLPPDVREVIDTTEKESASENKTTLWVCLSYGGRAEIVAAAKMLADSGSEISEESLRNAMWSAEMPDPDIIIRPGGEKRLSNFLLWQAAYSELFFVDPFWPEFSEEHLDQVLNEFSVRERRVGR